MRLTARCVGTLQSAAKAKAARKARADAAQAAAKELRLKNGEELDLTTKAAEAGKYSQIPVTSPADRERQAAHRRELRELVARQAALAGPVFTRAVSPTSFLSALPVAPEGGLCVFCGRTA